MKPKQKPRKWNKQRTILVGALLMLFVLLIYATLYQTTETNKPNPTNPPNQTPKQTQPTEIPSEITITPSSTPTAELKNAVILKVPAVNNKGQGVITSLAVETRPGSGRILIDIDSLLFFMDTQNSMRMARYVAENVTSIDTSNQDLIYKIYANASSIGGPSAGAALTIATIAAIQNLTLKEDVMITGSINHDGTIGPVSAIAEKATAASEIGAKLFLVPLTQSSETIYKTQRYCQKLGPTEFCTIEQVPKQIKVSEQVNIQIEEVKDIKQALKFFVKN